MSYQLVIDDSFNRSNTSVGSGANSTTGIGNGWIDFLGDAWSIQSHSATNSTTTDNTNITSPPLNALYRQSSENSANSQVLATFAPSSGGNCCVARFVPTSGGSGYAAMLYAGTFLYIYKCVNGSQSPIVSAHSTGVAAPANAILGFQVQQANSTTTSLTINLYDAASPSTVIATYTTTDATAQLQNLSGAAGIGYYNTASFSRLQTYIPSVALGAGTTTVGKVYKTFANLSASAATGGTGSITGQWYRSVTSGVLGTAISGATSLSLADSALMPATSYYYTYVATDSATPIPASVNYTQTVVTTIPATGYVIGNVGNSITAGTGSTSLDACDTEVVVLNGAGYITQNVNAGVGGSTTTNWLPGQPDFAAAVTAFNAAGVDTISLMLGTNDTQTSLRISAAQFKSDLQSIIAGFISQVSTVQRFVLNYDPYINPAGAGASLFDSTSDTLLLAYQPEIDSLVNGTTIFAGDKTAYAFFQANQSDLLDGVHPNQTGHNWLGTAWATAFEAAVNPTSSSSSSSSSSKSSQSSPSSNSSSSSSSEADFLASPTATTTNTGASLHAGISGGTASYTYSWTGIGLTFNSTTSANPTAAVSASGTYTAVVTVHDAHNNIAMGSVTFTVTAVAGSVSISPSSVNVSAGSNQQFSATVTDQFGNQVSSPSITWSKATGVESINGNGLYTASGRTVVTATCGSASGGALVTIPAELDFTQAIPTSNVAQTLGDALNAARAQGFGKWIISGTSLTLYAGDGITVVRTFTLDSATSPTVRL